MLVFMALSIFLEMRKESEAADAAFYNAITFLEKSVVGLGVHGWMMDGG